MVLTTQKKKGSRHTFFPLNPFYLFLTYNYDCISPLKLKTKPFKVVTVACSPVQTQHWIFQTRLCWGGTYLINRKPTALWRPKSHNAVYGSLKKWTILILTVTKMFYQFFYSFSSTKYFCHTFQLKKEKQIQSSDSFPPSNQKSFERRTWFS